MLVRIIRRNDICCLEGIEGIGYEEFGCKGIFGGKCVHSGYQERSGSTETMSSNLVIKELREEMKIVECVRFLLYGNLEMKRLREESKSPAVSVEENEGFELDEEVEKKSESKGNKSLTIIKQTIRSEEEALFILKQFKELKKIICNNSVPRLSVRMPDAVTRNTFNDGTSRGGSKLMPSRLKSNLAMNRISEASANFTQFQKLTARSEAEYFTKVIMPTKMLKIILQLHYRKEFSEMINSQRILYEDENYPELDIQTIFSGLSKVNVKKNFSAL